MIIELKVESGARFKLDKILMTWERFFGEEGTRYSHGKLYLWPRKIEVGSSVEIFTPGISGSAKVFYTTKVTEIIPIIRDVPEEVA